MHNMKITGIVECREKTSIKQLNISESSLYRLAASSNKISFYLNSKWTLNPLGALWMLKNKQTTNPTLCHLEASSHGWNKADFRLYQDIASSQWPCPCTYWQVLLLLHWWQKPSSYWECLASKHHARSLYFNSNTGSSPLLVKTNGSIMVPFIRGLLHYHDHTNLQNVSFFLFSRCTACAYSINSLLCFY